ncbi:MAG: glycosyl hydrolase, partial [Vicingaceae bacterium]
AYGPLWSEGGERGVYKTVDGGETWKRILHISDDTGISEIVMDPRNPDVIYAAAHQRRRHVFTYLGGGPESGIHKTTDGGTTWSKINNGLPKVDMGRIGLAISPANPEYIYAIVEASQDKGGFYRSTNRGARWEKRIDYSTSGNYYQEIVCDPNDENKVFSLNTWLHHTEDGGLTFKKTGEKSKHVDNHCMWIDPTNTKHWIVGCDGGMYETWDHADNWQYKPNLPLTQYYKVALDNAYPFYNIYGGTQDNNSQGGPSRTTNNAGIVNSDWFITNGGDGFESQIDPTDPNIVYAQSQYGWLVRYDKKSGEKVGIKPFPKKDGAALRWNWDAPLLISPHNNKRLYFAAQQLFKSDDRGDTWQEISGDLSRNLDRNKLKVMNKVWSIDAVMKNRSTTIFGNIVALDESTKEENLLYVGTDDGLVQVSENSGASWTKYSS